MIGTVIKQLREARQMLQKDLAEKAGLSTAYLSEIEAGKKSPSLKTMNSIADALGVPIGDLFQQDSPHDHETAS